MGREFGATTGRPRRCGWFDAVAARYAVRVNGLTSAVITKLDVLSGLDRIAIVTGYRSRGREVGFTAAGDAGLTQELTWYDGWNDDLSAIRKIDDLPGPARRYVDALEAALTVPIEAVSLGPERASLAVR
jgi:adenylosuccinate synthase